MIEEKMAPCGKQYVLRTQSISGRFSDVLEFVCEEFTDSRQTAKKRMKDNGLLVAVNTESEALQHIEHYAKHGLYAKYELEDELW